MSKASVTFNKDVGRGDSVAGVSTKGRVTFDSSNENKETCSAHKKSGSVLSQQSLADETISFMATSWAPQRRPAGESNDAASASMSSTISASVHHMVAVIVSTERGSIFRRKIVRVGGDIVDVILSESSCQTRRCSKFPVRDVTPTMSDSRYLIPRSRPEFKAFLDHAGIMGCRLVDAAANCQNKKLTHDFVDLAWSAVKLVNDPATSVAFAEVAAYLCHTLEMEDAAIHGITKERSEINQMAAVLTTGS